MRECRTTELNEKLINLCTSKITDEVLEEITEIKIDLNFEVDKEEIFWEQRARINWLHMGDRNMSSFIEVLQTGRERI